MGKDLHYSIMRFLEKRLDEHSAAKKWERKDLDDWIMYTISRYKFNDGVRVCLSDAYKFTDFDYHNRPPFLTIGDYILVAKPEGGLMVSGHLVDAARIGVGKLGEMMGALNSKEMWRYTPPSDEELKRRRDRSRK
ncbi:MAG: hypothetical protein EOS63_03090 [Mesorhizobium sp.]|uniref:hypothetical protein n=1 Tax=Mesorhizobium sp. TaxID=1871066 RepID=UPI000FE8D1B9|nr:hypothetical protein [Mesorhizobium sp.]RWE84484.1 MAG: hypothetical protein EOS63_03090 [Mesorhizobium sp.]TIT12470.1 MAG: hypothetical protein E5W74_09575 [Mesorhizobium sp.]TIU44400.1 MAG: hypothetical protein E5W31_00960 [Mesorhizobium sp.]TJW64432.1 MAG: hypothetical protein E5V97_07200 [Mesorhizobium sp.]